MGYFLHIFINISPTLRDRLLLCNFLLQHLNENNFMNGRKIKWGFLGTGWIANKLAEALKTVENTELIAVGSRNISTAKKFAKEFNIPKAYGSYLELVQDPEVDVVYIATPHNLHYENTILALEHNKHVLCEKPFAINGKEVRQMIQKAKEKNLFLMEAFWSRFLPNIIKTKELIESGELGSVKLLTAFFSIKSEQGPEQRHFNKELGGGSLLDIGIYNVFLSLFLLGKPKSFYAAAGMSKTEVDNSCSITFKYENETMAVMYSSLIAETPVIAEIHCEKGKIFLPHLWFCPGYIKIIYNDSKEVKIPFDFKSNGYNYEADEVVKCLRAGKTESNKMSLSKSLELIDMLDSIRKECGIVYPKHDF
jgi:scyllo-inositol 2-dehydrogenase (NADP+)